MSIDLLLVMVRDADAMTMQRDVTLADRHGMVFGHEVSIHDSAMWTSIAEFHGS
jgi:hypothetical protein